MPENVMTVEVTHETEIASPEYGDIFSLREASACHVISYRGGGVKERVEKQTDVVLYNEYNDEVL